VGWGGFLGRGHRESGSRIVVADDEVPRAGQDAWALADSVAVCICCVTLFNVALVSTACDLTVGLIPVETGSPPHIILISKNNLLLFPLDNGEGDLAVVFVHWIGDLVREELAFSL
jgi:hypothetical protein